MNKFTTLAALCLFSLMATASHAEEMNNDGGMMQDNMPMDNMSHSMDDTMSDGMEEHGMSDDGMSEDSMSHDGMSEDGMSMDDDMESGHMDTTDSMKE